MKVHLITYGDHKFKIQRDFFLATAKHSAFFDEITAYAPTDIDESFVMKFQDILKISRGGGYWIWKPYIVKKTMNALSEGDILVYCDMGCTINGKGRRRFKEYTAMLEASDSGSLAFELPHREIEYTTQEIFDFFESPTIAINSNQLMATIFLLKKCSHTVFLIDQWYAALCNFPESFMDDFAPDLQRKEFIAPRNDQSVFSMIRKIHGSEIIPDETYFSDFIRQGQDFPLWATRLRS